MADMIFAHCSLGCAETTRQQVFFDQVEENSPKQQNNKTTRQPNNKKAYCYIREGICNKDKGCVTLFLHTFAGVFQIEKTKTISCL